MRKAAILLVVAVLVVVPGALLLLRDAPSSPTQAESDPVAAAYREMQAQGYSNIICEPVGDGGASCSATRANGSGIVVGFGTAG
jgi:hypothetical protein